MAKSLLIVEFKEEAEFFLKNHPEIFTPDLKVLSLLPEASAFLKRRGIPYQDTLNYFSRSSHEQGILFVDKIIQDVNHEVSITDENGITDTYVNSLTFYLRSYLSYVFIVIETIQNFLEAHPADEIYVGQYSGSDASGCSLLAKERFLGKLVELLSAKCKVRGYAITMPRNILPRPFEKTAKAWAAAFLNARELMAFSKRRFPSILVYSLKFSFDSVVRDLNGFQCFNLVPDKKSFLKLKGSAAGMDVHNVHLNELWSLADRKFNESCQRALKVIGDLHQTRKLFFYRGIDFSAIMMPKIKDGYLKEFKYLNRRIFSLKKVLRALKPSVILAPMSRDISFALGEVSRMLKIPSILISHGSHVPPQNEYERKEWRDHGRGLIETDYKFHLLQSPWAVEYVRAMGIKKEYHRVHPIIFPQVDRLHKEQKKEAMFPLAKGKKIIVHAGTPKPRGSNRLYIYETVDEYIENIKDLIEAVHKMPDVLLVVRFRPSNYLSMEDLKTLLPADDSFVIAADGSFADYLTIADLVVSFSSTTIEEALINDIPVVQYDRTGRYVHIPGSHWQDKGFAHVDSVYYIGDRAVLRPALNWIVTNHLESTIVGDLFKHHKFEAHEAVSLGDFIESVVGNEAVDPILFNEVKHVNLEEIY